MSPSSTSSEAPESGYHEENEVLLAADEAEDHASEVASWKSRAWWKRPSPYWLVFGAPISSIGYSAAFPPRVEVYTQLVCRVHKPEYFPDSPSSLFGEPLTRRVAQVHSTTNPTQTGSVDDPSYLFIPNTTYDDPEIRTKCATDSDVQAAVARLSAALVTTMGILSCLVTGWWGTFSDRHGRRFVLAASIVGLFLTELVFIITANFVDYLPGGYWFLLVGFVIEGLLGSMPTGVAANHAYMADTTEPSSRSRMFSLALGLVFAGFAVGPVIGGLTLHLTGSTLSVFYLAAVLHFVYACLLIFVLPESLTKVRARNVRLRYNAEKEKNMNAPIASRMWKEATTFLSALTVLLPRDTVDGNPLRQHKKDWSLFLLAISYALNTSITASLPFIFQYAVAVFSWTPETTNYYFASGGVSRALVLIVILPLILKYLKRTKTPLADTPQDLDELHQGTLFNLSRSRLRSRSRAQQPSTRAPPLTNTSTRSFKIDVILARCALAIEICAHLVMATATSGIVFAIATVIGSVSVAFPPIAQAIALELYSAAGMTGAGKAARIGQDEVGRLFGAMSVLQALGSQIIGPAVFGYVYSHTVATFPQAIMLVSALQFTIAFVLLGLVKIPVPHRVPVLGRDAEEGGGSDDGANEEVREEVLVDVAEGRVAD
ncbi:major facilitator superfamily domain-containing protein [Scleroderma yunnanense]